MKEMAIPADPSPVPLDRRPIKVVALLLLLSLFWVLSPVLVAMVAGGFAVLVAQRPFERFVLALRGRRLLAAALATAGVALVVLLPLTAAALAGWAQAADAARWLVGKLGPSGGLRASLEKMPGFIRDALPGLLESARAALVDSAARAAALVPRAAASVGRMLVGVLLSLVTVFYLFLQGPALVAFLLRVSPLQQPQTSALLREVRAVALGLFRGGVLAALYHGTGAAIGFAIFGLPHVLLLGLLTAAASLVPLVGTGLVCVPLVVGLALSGAVGKAIGLGIYSVLVVGFGDQLLRPMWSKGAMALPRLLLFLTIFGGLQIFGPIGLLLGPLAGSLAVVALELVAEPLPAVSLPSRWP